MSSAYLLTSQKDAYWSLAPELWGDFFEFRREGTAALLLLAMHLSESLPWVCARHPVWLAGDVGRIDQACKRILGKRYRAQDSLSNTELADLPHRPLQAIQVICSKLRSHTPEFPRHPLSPPPLLKEAGKLLPRKLLATAEVELEDRSFRLYSRNFSELSQCLHAELCLVLELGAQLYATQYRGALKSFVLQTTRKPCKMCAAFLYWVSLHCLDFNVRYEEDDPGPLAAQTLLDRFGYQHSIGKRCYDRNLGILTERRINSETRYNGVTP